MLDRVPVCPWTYHISGLFNDRSFKPDPIESFVNGVRRYDIAKINPSNFEHHHDCGVLSREWAEVRVHRQATKL
jgi:hypothetical protein